MSRQVFQSPLFSRAKKHLTKTEAAVLDQEIWRIADAPEIGEAKKGDLTGVYVHKFKVREKLFLLAYEFDDQEIILFTVGLHENFYRDLKRYVS